MTAKYINSERESLKFVKSELDVSNLITLEQDVNDELIINQKDDKLLITSLYEDDDLNGQSMHFDNGNATPAVKNFEIKNPCMEAEIEEIIDDKWSLFSR